LASLEFFYKEYLKRKIKKKTSWYVLDAANGTMTFSAQFSHTKSFVKA